MTQESLSGSWGETLDLDQALELFMRDDPSLEGGRISPEGAEYAQRDNADHPTLNIGTQSTDQSTDGEFPPENSTSPPTEGVIPHEETNESVIRSQSETIRQQATKNVSRTGSNNIPTRLPMRRMDWPGANPQEPT